MALIDLDGDKRKDVEREIKEMLKGGDRDADEWVQVVAAFVRRWMFLEEAASQENLLKIKLREIAEKLKEKFDSSEGGTNEAFQALKAIFR